MFICMPWFVVSVLLYLVVERCVKRETKVYPKCPGSFNYIV